MLAVHLYLIEIQYIESDVSETFYTHDSKISDLNRHNVTCLSRQTASLCRVKNSYSKQLYHARIFRHSRYDFAYYQLNVTALKRKTTCRQVVMDRVVLHLSVRLEGLQADTFELSQQYQETAKEKEKLLMDIEAVQTFLEHLIQHWRVEYSYGGYSLSPPFYLQPY